MQGETTQQAGIDTRVDATRAMGMMDSGNSNSAVFGAELNVDTKRIMI
jgi:hypothetical protein